MDERIFARFHLDAGIGDVVSPPLETIVCRDWLGFAGIQPSRVRMIAREQQFAEKLHAYTLPRNSANSRVKDLVDMTLLIDSGGLDRRRVADALHLTFERRGTHELPASLIPPPADWQIPFSSPGGRMQARRRSRHGVCGSTGVSQRIARTAHRAVNAV